MDNWLNYHHLYYFRTIAAEGSIAKAAERLRVGQPTLSAQLRQLEEKLGFDLFERQHKRLILTEQGRVALEYASEIFRMGGEMLEALQDRQRPERIHVQLGALDSIPKHLISALVKAAYQIAPCSVSVLEGDDALLLRELLAHRIDLILTNHPPRVTEGRKLYTRSIGKTPVVVCGSKKFAKARKGFPGSLAGVPFVMPTAHSKLRQDVDHYFASRRISPEVVAETQDTSLQKLLGIDGVGVVPISLLGVESLIERRELVELGVLEGVYEEIFLASTSRRIENPVSARLLQSFNF
jgi:LysR family transcriptional activator of nhaA